MDTFESAAVEEAETIERLIALCRRILLDLSRYRSIEYEEKMLNRIEAEL